MPDPYFRTRTVEVDKTWDEYNYQAGCPTSVKGGGQNSRTEPPRIGPVPPPRDPMPFRMNGRGRK